MALRLHRLRRLRVPPLEDFSDVSQYALVNWNDVTVDKALDAIVDKTLDGIEMATALVCSETQGGNLPVEVCDETLPKGFSAVIVHRPASTCHLRSQGGLTKAT